MAGTEKRHFMAQAMGYGMVDMARAAGVNAPEARSDAYVSVVDGTQKIVENEDDAEGENSSDAKDENLDSSSDLSPDEN